MRVFLKTTLYLLKAQLQSPLFYALLAALIACAVLPLFAGTSAQKAAAVVDEDGSALSQALVSGALGNHAMKLEKVAEGDLPAALNRLRSGSLEAVFIIGEGYEKSIMDGEYRGVIKLYLSPYSTSARTFSDSFAALVMSQWLEHAAASEAEKQLGEEAGREAERVFAEGSPPILRIDVEGEANQSRASGSPGSKPLHSLYLLAALSCFLILCLSGTIGQEQTGLLERFKSRGWSAASYTFARPAAWALVSAAAAFIPCVYLACIGEISGGLLVYVSFLLYLAAWVGVSSALNCLLRNPSAQLTFAVMLSILNAIFAYPSGLFQSVGFVRFLMPGWWFTQALGQAPDYLSTLPIAAMALVAIGVGILIAKIKHMND